MIKRNNKTYGVETRYEYPDLVDITITENGTYNHTGEYGYDEVKVEVPETVLGTLNATSNGTFTPSGGVDGYDEVNVNVQPNLEPLSVTRNDTYTPTAPVQGFSSVTVEVPAPVISLQDKTANQNGEYTADEGYDGLGTVTVNVSATPTPDYFYVESLTTENTLSIYGNDSEAPAIEVFKSTDQTNWTSMGTTSETPITAAIPPHSRLYLKAVANRWSGGEWGGHPNIISCSKEFNVGGMISSLLFGNVTTNTLTSANEFAFNKLFMNVTTLVSAGNLILPTNVVYGCFNRTFENCSMLEIPCELPVTTLAEGCYEGMFQYDSLLKYAPVLPATSLPEMCYNVMFYGSSSLKEVTIYAASVPSNTTTGWLTNAESTGTVYNLGGATLDSGDDGVPSGWTEVTSL